MANSWFRFFDVTNRLYVYLLKGAIKRIARIWKQLCKFNCTFLKLYSFNYTKRGRLKATYFRMYQTCHFCTSWMKQKHKVYNKVKPKRIFFSANLKHSCFHHLCSILIIPFMSASCHLNIASKDKFSIECLFWLFQSLA